MTFAPGEGNRPLGIFMDKGSEFLSFPTIYCGQTRADKLQGKDNTCPLQHSMQMGTEKSGIEELPNQYLISFIN